MALLNGARVGWFYAAINMVLLRSTTQINLLANQHLDRKLTTRQLDQQASSTLVNSVTRTGSP